MRPPKSKWLFRLTLVGAAIILPPLWLAICISECWETVKDVWEVDPLHKTYGFIWDAFKAGHPVP